MPDVTAAAHTMFLPQDELESLIQALRGDGYRVIGPRIDQQAIIYDEIESAADLPRGWTDRQEPAHYRLEQRADDKYFGYVIGPHSWKQFLFPPRAVVATADRTEDGWALSTPPPDGLRFAFLGVRACEIAAIEVQDRTFLHGPYVDTLYKDRRENALIIAVNCTQAASTCFCTSMNTGPRCRSGFDLALTEIEGGFTVEVGSDRGQAVLDRLDVVPATQTHEDSAEASRQQAVDDVARNKGLNTGDIRNLLLGNLEHPRWDDVAGRCLSCTNCTMVCPTCFCSSVSEVTDLTETHVERQRQWDSCFNVDFSYMNGGVIRNGIRSRYRQWLTHKVASWHDQFDVSGCVGCGRCITWCPVGIDLRDEVAAIRESDQREPADGSETAP